MHYGIGIFVAVALSFFVSASAGMGGSLILVPAVTLLVGTKEGVALAALLLAGNNVVKVAAYRRHLPLRSAALVIGLTAVGTAVGSRLLVAAPEGLVAAAVVASLSAAVIGCRYGGARVSRVAPPMLAFASGTTSGFAGTSGPLKAGALRSLGLDRRHFVGAAALVSLLGDATKAGVYTHAGLLTTGSYTLAAASLPLMVVATLAGRHFNESIGERGFSRLFWTLIGAYGARLLLTAA